jgi:tetratricopeptide (TPR) repeat protein
VITAQRFVPAFALLVAGPPLGCQEPRGSVDVVTSVPSERYRAALRLGAAGDLRAARTELSAVLSADSTHRSARLRAKVLDDVDAGRIPAATAVHLFRAMQHAEGGRYTEALAEADTAILLSPRYDEAHRVRGRSYVDVGDSERATRDYTEAIRLNPGNVTAWSNRASVHIRRGEPAKAIGDLDEAIRRGPNEAETYVNRGAAYGMQGMVERAIADLDRAIQLDTGLAPAYANKAQIYENAGKRAEAIETLKALIRNARPGYGSIVEEAIAKIRQLGGS